MSAITSSSTSVLDDYLKRTPGSRRWMERAQSSMPGGNTRTTTFHPPYPVMFDRGNGSWLTDMDGHRHVDLHYNGLSIIHGHAFAPTTQALTETAQRGTAWSGASDLQIEFAELLTSRIPGKWQARFANSGSEAAMLALKVARRMTGRPLVLKFADGYHGSYPDLEVGLYGIKEMPGKAVLATFNDGASLKAAFARHGAEIAAVVYEPVMFTGRAVVAEPGFLEEVERLAKRHGALSILDDCLMLRLAPGGSVEKFGLDPDLIALGKFIGGGTALGAVLGRPELMRCFDPHIAGSMFHGGSFNGHVLGCAAGLAALKALDAESIARMDGQMERLRKSLARAAAEYGFAVTVSGMGSVAGISFDDDPTRHEADPSALGLAGTFHLACLNAGIAMGPGGLLALATSIGDPELAFLDQGFGAAFGGLRAALPSYSGR